MRLKDRLKYLARFAQAAARYIRHKSRNTHTLGEQQQPGAARGNERLSTCKRVSVSSTWPPRMCTRASTLCTNHAARTSHRESRESSRDDDNNFDWCTAVILAGRRPDPNDCTCHFYFALARAKSFIGDI